MFHGNRSRSLLALLVIIGQSFFFNAIFFTYGLIVKKFYGVYDQRLLLHLLPFAVGCLFGPCC